MVEPRRTEGPPRMTEEPPQKARKAQQKRSQVASNFDVVLGIKGGSMSNLLQVVNALQADEDEQMGPRMLRNVAREPFEEVRRDLALPLASGGEVVVPVADPSSLVAASIRASDTMQAIFMPALKSHPCTLATPWHLLVTWDEFTPGSMHNPNKPKKCMPHERYGRGAWTCWGGACPDKNLPLAPKPEKGKKKEQAAVEQKPTLDA